MKNPTNTLSLLTASALLAISFMGCGAGGPAGADKPRLILAPALESQRKGLLLSLGSEDPSLPSSALSYYDFGSGEVRSVASATGMSAKVFALSEGALFFRYSAGKVSMGEFKAEDKTPSLSETIAMPDLQAEEPQRVVEHSAGQTLLLAAPRSSSLMVTERRSGALVKRWQTSAEEYMHPSSMLPVGGGRVLVASSAVAATFGKPWLGLWQETASGYERGSFPSGSTITPPATIPEIFPDQAQSSVTVAGTCPTGLFVSCESALADVEVSTGTLTARNEKLPLEGYDPVSELIAAGGQKRFFVLAREQASGAYHVLLLEPLKEKASTVYQLSASQPGLLSYDMANERLFVGDIKDHQGILVILERGKVRGETRLGGFPKMGAFIM